jgi:polyhydroxyalkanoate synthase
VSGQDVSASEGAPSALATLLDREGRRLRNGIRYARGQRFTELEPTKKDLVWNQGKVELHRYRNDDIRFHPPVVLMLGLVSKSSLFDLYEGSSMARALVDAGFDTYVIRWGEADAGDAENTVEHYVQRYLPRMLRAVCRISGSEDATLLGYCMGGNFALLGVAGVPGLPVRNLITMASPIDFDEMPPQFIPLRDERFDPRDFVDDSGCIPGDMVANFYELRRPTAALAQLVTLAERLNDERYVAIHQAIAHWTSDHVPMPIGVAEQVIEHWLRENAFATGRLRLGGVPVDLKRITCPTLCVLTLRDEVIPPAAARPLDGLLGSKDFQLLELEAGHIGLAFGRSARQLLHPRLIEWLTVHSTPLEVAAHAPA